ncbi:hypothetical protein [Paenibacillus sp. Mc5Re-14]|uniref:hypothetical protein n=1 Tax=Paenibacillus sp. Mc5Re-14 TaxID=1030529 RepID=UPI000B0612C5|nr:hypothetical protein [Paenibacillus sp. Mc5Re-14]
MFFTLYFFINNLFQYNGWGLKDMFILGNRQMTQSPVKDQSYVWVAEYYDGTNLAEYSFDTGKPNSFYAVDKKKVVRFGLLGESSQAFFDVGNGVFTINNHRITVSYEAEGVEYPLTGRALVYNDLITYKDAVSDAAPFMRGEGAFTNSILQFNIGYKKKMELLDVNINFQNVLSIPTYDSPFFQIKISADKDLDGKLIIRRNGTIVDEIHAPLKADMSGNLNWTIR